MLKMNRTYMYVIWSIRNEVSNVKVSFYQKTPLRITNKMILKLGVEKSKRHLPQLPEILKIIKHETCNYL